MKFRPGIILVALVLVLNGASARAGVFTFSAQLSGAAEAPPNDSAGFGSTWVTIDTDNNTMRVEVVFGGLTGNTSASHVHAATTLPNAGLAGVATELPSFTGFPLGVKSGTYDHTFDTSLDATWNNTFRNNNGGTAASATAAFLAALQAQKAYLNIHTSYKPGGEIRGFLAPVPEPATFGSLLAGAAALPILLRRRAAKKASV